MRLVLRLLDGRTKDLELEGTDSVETVRLKVAAVTNVHPELQCLIVVDGDVVLADGKTVAERQTEEQCMRRQRVEFSTGGSRRSVTPGRSNHFTFIR